MTLTTPSSDLQSVEDEAAARQEAVERIEEMFCRPNSPYPGYQLQGRSVEVLLRGRLSRAVLRDPNRAMVEVIVFHGVTDLAGDLWSQEMRTLYRLDGLGHPGLPEIRGGNLDRDLRTAFTMTRRTGEAVEIGEAVRWARDHRVSALEQFAVLLDALSQLHGARMLHRSLTLNALRFTATPSSADRRVSLSLARFELGVWLGNLIRRTSRPESEEAAQRAAFVRTVFLTPPPGTTKARHIVYIAPEQHGYVFGIGPGGRRDWPATDVFGLGVFGWELFCGELPTELPDEYARLEQALAGDAAQAVAALNAVHAAMRASLLRRQEAGTLPKLLAEVLLAMLGPLPQDRRSAAELTESLDRGFAAVVARWEPAAGPTVPHLVGYTRPVVGDLVTNHWITKTQASDDRAIEQWLGRELAEAQLVWSPSGARFHGSPRCEEPQSAQWVLLGGQGVWFCREHIWRGMDPREPRQVYPRLLTIQHVVARQEAPGLARSRHRRLVGPIDVAPVDDGRRLEDELIEGRPLWTDLREAVERTDADPRIEGDAELVHSLAFLLRYHAVRAETQIYAFERRDDGGRGTAVIAGDRERDRDWLHDDSVRAAYARFSDRLELVDFGRELLAQGKAVEVVPVTGRHPNFADAGRLVEVEIDRELADRPGGDEIRLVPTAGYELPARGWLRPAGETGSTVAIRRQINALAQLENRRTLLRSMHAPESVELNRDRWSRLDDKHLPGAPANPLDGAADSRVTDMLSYHPFYALQGPPGTGKTTVVIRAIRRLLYAEPGARILVAAQANPAVDNLGNRLVQQLPPETIVIRHASRTAADKLDLSGGTRARTVNQVTADVVQNITKSLPVRIEEERRRAAPDVSARAKLAEAWLRQVGDSGLELADRISRCASVVLTTCSAAATLEESDAAAIRRFDWVVVEEAAKAWPTELLVPLVAGIRWALVGDHKQLGPHRANELAGFLRSLEGRREPEIKHWAAGAERHLEAVQVFGNLFGAVDPEGEGPVQLLHELFRMPDEVAEPFARAFYGSGEVGADNLPETILRAGNDTVRASRHGMTRPQHLEGRPIVWLDTGDRTDCVQEGSWRNPGEVQLVRQLVQHMRPQVLPPGADQANENGLVVLTPYRDQLGLLGRFDELRGRVHTVHSFQGGEADRAIVSLVRSRRSAVGRRRAQPGPEGPRSADVRGAVGFLGEEEIVNVLLSRAKRSLIVIGDFALFEQFGGPAWATVLAVFRARQARVVLQPRETL